MVPTPPKRGVGAATVSEKRKSEELKTMQTFTRRNIMTNVKTVQLHRSLHGPSPRRSGAGGGRLRIHGTPQAAQASTSLSQRYNLQPELPWELTQYRNSQRPDCQKIDVRRHRGHPRGETSRLRQHYRSSRTSPRAPIVTYTYTVQVRTANGPDTYDPDHSPPPRTPMLRTRPTPPLQPIPTVTLWGGIIVGSPGAGTISQIPAGAETGLSVGATLDIGGGTYSVAAGGI